MIKDQNEISEIFIGPSGIVGSDDKRCFLVGYNFTFGNGGWGFGDCIASTSASYVNRALFIAEFKKEHPDWKSVSIMSIIPVTANEAAIYLAQEEPK